MILYKETYKEKEYDKFKFPTEMDMLERRVDMMEQKLAHMLGETIVNTKSEPQEDLPVVEEESDDLPF